MPTTRSHHPRTSELRLSRSILKIRGTPAGRLGLYVVSGVTFAHLLILTEHLIWKQGSEKLPARPRWSHFHVCSRSPSYPSPSSFVLRRKAIPGKPVPLVMIPECTQQRLWTCSCDPPEKRLKAVYSLSHPLFEASVFSRRGCSADIGSGPVEGGTLGW